MKNLLFMPQHLIWQFRMAVNLGCTNERELQYRLLKLPDQPHPGRFFTFPWGEIEFINASDLRGQYFEIFVQRHYAFLSSVPNPVIIDAGGNIGMSAIWFKREYPQGTVTVFEADPELVAVLQRNLTAAQVADVKVVNAAVWTENGSVAFDNRGKDMGAVKSHGSIRVPAVDLSMHLPQRVDLLKLDVEGAEYPIVKRLCETGAIARIINLVAEYHIHRDEFDDFVESLRLLRAAGFQVAATSKLGPWLGQANPSTFELVGRNQILAEVYAWRPTQTQSEQV